MHVTVPFLISAAIQADIPDALSPEPDLGAIVAYGGTPRQIGYRAASRTEDQRVGLQYQFSVSTGGREIEVYQTPEPPQSLIAFWPFPTGKLSTFVEAGRADAWGNMEAIIRHVDVATGPSGLPHVALRRPVTSGDATEPGEKEVVTFFAFSVDPPDGLVALRFFVEPVGGRAAESFDDWGPTVQASVTVPAGFTVSCEGPATASAALRATARQVADSIVM